MKVIRIQWLIAMGLMETAQICVDSLWDKLMHDKGCNK